MLEGREMHGGVEPAGVEHAVERHRVAQVAAHEGHVGVYHGAMAGAEVVTPWPFARLQSAA